jgi:multiple sugar transport system substrate-binding protein
VYAHGQNDKDSVIKDKFDTAPLPGLTGPGVSTLGGHSNAIGKYADNKGTALAFLKFTATPEMQKQAAIQNALTPVLEETYKDPEVLKKYPFFTTELKTVQGAKPRPKAVEYGDVTLAIQDAAYGALQDGANGKTADATAAVQGLQTKLETLIK